MSFYCINPDCLGPNEVSGPGDLCRQCQQLREKILENQDFRFANNFGPTEFQGSDSSFLEDGEPSSAFSSTGALTNFGVEEAEVD